MSLRVVPSVEESGDGSVKVTTPYEVPERNKQGKNLPLVGVEHALSSLGQRVREWLSRASVFIGVTHGETPWSAPRNGANFVSLGKNGWGYFGAKRVYSQGNFSVSVVGTINPAGEHEAGFGVTYKIPTRYGDIAFFINMRQGAWTLDALSDFLQGKVKGEVTVSVNFGAMYSASDAVTKALLTNPKTALIGMLGGGILDLGKVDLWVGLGGRGEATFRDGRLVSMRIFGEEIPINDFFQGLVSAVQDKKASDEAPPRQLYRDGRSPWDEALRTQVMNGIGIVGTSDVANPATVMAAAVYRLGIEYGILKRGERIHGNAHAGRVIDAVLKKARERGKVNKQQHGKETAHYWLALQILVNPYGLNFGSKPLQQANDEQYPKRNPGPDDQWVRDAFRGK